jgi:uncharacterized MnhB-related membrane protein
MTAIVAVTLGLVALGGTVIVFTSDPLRQAVTLSIYGLVLAVVFLELSAPDVALSQIGVSSAIVPLIIMLAIRKIRARR